MKGAGDKSICWLPDITAAAQLVTACEGYIDVCDAYRKVFATDEPWVDAHLPRTDGGTPVAVSSYNVCRQAAHDLPLAFGAIDASLLRQQVARLASTLEISHSPPPLLPTTPPNDTAATQQPLRHHQRRKTRDDHCPSEHCYVRDFQPQIGNDLEKRIPVVANIAGTLKGAAVTISYSCTRKGRDEQQYTLTYHLEDDDGNERESGTRELTRIGGRWESPPHLELHLRRKNDFTTLTSAHIL